MHGTRLSPLLLVTALRRGLADVYLFKFTAYTSLVFCVAMVCSQAAAQPRSWNKPSGGAFSEPTNWTPNNTPDTAAETAVFELFGDYRVEFADAESVTLQEIEHVRGDVTLVGLGETGASIHVVEDVSLSVGDFLFERGVFPSDVSLDVAGALRLNSGAYLHIEHGATVDAAVTEIGAGTTTKTTEIWIDHGAHASLGALSVGEVGGGNFEGSLTLFGASSVEADQINIATTPESDRNGIVQLFGESGLTTPDTGVVNVGNTEGLGVAILAFVGDSTLSGGQVNVLDSGRFLNDRSSVHFESGLTIDGGEYTENGDATRTFGPGSRLVITGGGQATLGQNPWTSPVTLASGSLTAPAGVAVSNASLRLESGHSTIDGDVTLTSAGQLEATNGADVRFLGNVEDRGGLVSVEAGAILRFEGSYQGRSSAGGGLMVFSDRYHGHYDWESSPGSMHHDGDIESTATSEFLLKLGDNTHGALSVDGNATIAGELIIEFEDLGSGDYTPATGDSFEIVAASSISGGFDTVAAPPLSGGLAWRLHPTARSITLHVVAPSAAGDYNADGLVDAADYTVWRDSYGFSGAQLLADGDNDGTIGDGDFVVWRDAYEAAFEQGQTVPEPLTALLLLAVLVAGDRRRCAL